MKDKAKNIRPGERVKLSTSDGKTHNFTVKDTVVDTITFITKTGKRFTATGEEELDVDRKEELYG